jgi:hypothetical protein
MGQAKQRKEEITGLKSNAQRYVVVLARDNLTKETRLSGVPVINPFMNQYEIAGSDDEAASVCAAMVRKYVAMDNDLDELQCYHLVNWSLGVMEHCKKKDVDDVDGIFAHVWPADTLKDAQAMITKLQTRFG